MITVDQNGSQTDSEIEIEGEDGREISRKISSREVYPRACVTRKTHPEKSKISFLKISIFLIVIPRYL